MTDFTVIQKNQFGQIQGKLGLRAFLQAVRGQHWGRACVCSFPFYLLPGKQKEDYDVLKKFSRVM